MMSAIPNGQMRSDPSAPQYIESYYNVKRRHSSIGYLSPIAFETTIAD